jgi:hypothetical protein
MWRLLTRVAVVSARKSCSEEMCKVDGSLTAGNVGAESTKFGVVWGNVKTLSLLQLPNPLFVKKDVPQNVNIIIMATRMEMESSKMVYSTVLGSEEQSCWGLIPKRTLKPNCENEAFWMILPRGIL